MAGKVKEPSFNLMTTRVTSLLTPGGERVKVRFQPRKGRLIAVVEGAKISHELLPKSEA